MLTRQAGGPHRSVPSPALATGCQQTGKPSLRPGLPFLLCLLETVGHIEPDNVLGLCFRVSVYFQQILLHYINTLFWHTYFFFQFQNVIAKYTTCSV